MVPLLLDAVKQMTVKMTCQVVIVGELLCLVKRCKSSGLENEITYLGGS